MNPPAHRSSPRAALLLLPLFLSGFCGISYEVLYSRLMADVIGGHYTVNAAILVTFLLGIAVGTRVAWRFANHLYAVEWAIGVYAIVFGPWLLPALDRLVFQSALANHLPVQIGMVCLALIVPSTCIGATLPLFSGLIKPLLPSRVFGLAYMVYNFGAALTALLIEFWLIRRFGIRATLQGIAGINLLVGTLLFVGRRALPSPARSVDRPAPAADARGLKYGLRPVAALAAVSVASAIFQLFMLKLVQFVYGPFHETFAMVLFLVLVGIALGAIVGQWRRLGFGAFVALNILSMAILLALCRPILEHYALYQRAHQGIGLIGFRLAILAMLMGPSAIWFGAAIPALMSAESNVARESGFLLSVSSLANAAGFLAMVLVLHQRFLYGELILIMAGLLGLAWIFHFWGRPVLASIGPMLVLVAFPAHARFWSEDLFYGSHTDFESLPTLQRKMTGLKAQERFREHDEVLSIRDNGGSKTFNLNGYYSIGTGHLSEHQIALMSALCSPRLDEALVLGLGTGSTAGTVPEYFRHTDIVEISPLVIEHQDAFAATNFNLPAKSNVDILCDDGIRFLKRTHKRYDLIVNSVTNPLYFSSGKLYTSDFFRMVKDHLTDGGVYTTAFGTSLGNLGVGIIVQSLKSSFNHCWVGAMRYGYWLLLCSDSPATLRQDGKIEQNETVRRYFAGKKRDIANLRYSLVADDAFGALSFTGPAPQNTLDRPALEFEMARLSLVNGETAEQMRDWIIGQYDPDRFNRTLYRSAPIDYSRMEAFWSQIDPSSKLSQFFIHLAQGKSHEPKDDAAEPKSDAEANPPR